MSFKSRLKISDPNGLVQQPHDPYWDAPITRREVQLAVNDLCVNEAELMARCDTSYIVMNFVCEKLGIKREELDEYVAKKKVALAQQKAIQDAIVTKELEAQNGRSNP